MKKLQNHKSQTTIYKFLLALALVFAYSLIRLFAYSSEARAQQTLPLTVVPPKQEVLINPGEHFSTSVKFLNQGDSPVSGTLSVIDFIVSDDQGTPVFLDNPQVVGTSTIPAKYSAAKWITIPQNNMVIPGKANGSISVTINVPKNAAAGGRYAAVIFEPSGNLTLGNPVSGQETPVAIRLASLIYIRVAGPISEKASVTKFQGPSFLEYGPVTISTQILNEGNYHITPQGTINIKDMFGRVVGKTDLETRNIFPGTSRSYSSKVGEKLMFGKFTVTLAATYGDNGLALDSTFALWIFPWKVALAILLGIIIIILAVTLWYKRFKKTEEKLVEELKEEKTELEGLKEQLKDKISGENKPKDQSPPAPPKETTQ